MPSAVTLTVSNLRNSTSFFLSALQPLDYQYRGATDNDTTIAFGSALNPESPPDFWLTQEIPGVPAGAVHVAFSAKTRIAVQQFFSAALNAGARIHGEPAVRDASGYYSGAVIDFDGNSVEAVYRSHHPASDRENLPSSSVVVPAASTTEVSHAATRTPETRIEAAKAPPSSPKVHTVQSGDVIDVAANIARNVASHLRPGSSNSISSNREVKENSDNRGPKATIGALMGIATGAALTYAFGKDKDRDKGSKECHSHRPFSPPRSSTYPGSKASRYRSSASDLSHEDYQYTRSPLEMEAPPFRRRRSSSCDSPSGHRKRATTVGETEYPRHRREISSTYGGSGSRRSRRNSLQSVDAPRTAPSPSTMSKHSPHSHVSKHQPIDGSTTTITTTKHSHTPSKRDRDRNSYPPSSFSPTTKSKVASAACQPQPVSRARSHTYDALGSNPNPSEATIKPTRHSSTSTRTRHRRDSKLDREAHLAEPPPPPPQQQLTQPSGHKIYRRRPRADTWHGPGPDDRHDRRERLQYVRRPKPPQPPAQPPPAVPPPFYRRKSRSEGHHDHKTGSSPTHKTYDEYHRSRKGSMRKHRVVGVVDPDTDYDTNGIYDNRGRERERNRDRDLRERGLKGGIMDKEVGPDDSISQVSTNIA